MAGDELTEIGGIKPKRIIQDGEEVEAKSQSSKSAYKVKRTFDHYFCSCPAWRNQGGVPVNARSCKHLRAMLGDAYEDARLQLKNPGGAAPAKGGARKAPARAAAKPASKSAPTTRKRKKADEEEEEEEAEKPVTKAPRGGRNTRASTRGKAKKEAEVVDEEEEEEEEEHRPVKKRRTNNRGRKGKEAEAVKAAPNEDQNQEMAEADGVPDVPVEEAKDDPTEEKVAGDTAAGDDELAEINGIKPNVVIKDGDEVDAKSMTSDTVYKVKRTWDHYYCTCPAWRNQGGMPVNARSCKHLRQLLGDAYEDARLALKNPDGFKPQSKSGGKKPASRATRSKKAAGADADDDDADDASAGKKQPDLLLANKWDVESGPDPTGWWISEKLDGVRTYYDGKRMISRLGNPFTPPQSLLDKLPKDMTLDGELFGGRGEFQSTVSVVKTLNLPHWQNITFQIFDVPSSGDLPFEDRVALLQKTFGPGGSHAAKEIVVVAHEEARDREHVLEKLKEIEGLGGEGLMLRKPGSTYVGSRSSTLLKVKTFYDAEALVTGHLPGKGQHKGATGALQCVMASGKRFSVGTGLSHAQRQHPPRVGAVVVYRFQELTRDGVPRFPTFVGEAADKTEAKDAEVPEHRKAGAAGGGD